MEAKDEKMKVLQAIFSSGFGFKLPWNVPTNTHTQRNKKVSEPVRETWWYKQAANDKDLFQNVSKHIQNNTKILGSDCLSSIQTFGLCHLVYVFFITLLQCAMIKLVLKISTFWVSFHFINMFISCYSFNIQLKTVQDVL